MSASTDILGIKYYYRFYYAVAGIGHVYGRQPDNSNVDVVGMKARSRADPGIPIVSKKESCCPAHEKMLRRSCSIPESFQANPVCEGIDMTNSEIIEPKKRGRPFEKGQSGNPAGRPRGARNALTHMAEGLMADATEAMVQTFIDQALEGNVPALILAMKRILPPCPPQPLQFALPPLESAADAPAAISAIVAGLAEGDLIPTEAHALIGAVEAYLKIHGELEIVQRLAVLEEKIAGIQAQNELRKITPGESTP